MSRPARGERADKIAALIVHLMRSKPQTIDMLLETGLFEANSMRRYLNALACAGLVVKVSSGKRFPAVYWWNHFYGIK